MNSNYIFKQTMDFLLDYPWIEKIIINKQEPEPTQQQDSAPKTLNETEHLVKEDHPKLQVETTKN